MGGACETKDMCLDGGANPLLWRKRRHPMMNRSGWRIVQVIRER